MPMILRYTVLASALALSARTEIDSPEKLAVIESRVLPVLAEHCYGCHSDLASASDKLKAWLSVDSKQGLLASGEDGTTLVQGKPKESLIMKVLWHQIKDAEMPPRGTLPSSVIADVPKWIEVGAPDPRTDAVVDLKPTRVIDTQAVKELTPKHELLAEIEAYQKKEVRLGAIMIGDHGALYSGGWGGGNFVKLKGDARMSSVMGHPEVQKLAQTEPLNLKQDHMLEWIDAAMGNGKTYQPLDVAARSMEVFMPALVSYRMQRAIDWDGPNMRVPNAPEADKFITPDYRKHWL